MQKIKNILINTKAKKVLLISISIIGILIVYSKFLYPQIIQKIFFVAETFATLEQYDKGTNELNKGLFFNPFDSEIYYRKGNAYALINRNKEAFNNYRIAIILNRKNPKVYASRSILYSTNFDFARAEFDIDKAIKLDPKNPMYYGMKATLYMVKDINKAIELLTQAIKLDNKFGFAYFTRGKLRMSKNDINGAINDLTIAINIDPNHADNYATRSTAYLMQENPKAIIDAEKAVSLSPQDPNMHYNNALVAYGFYDFIKAKKEFDYAKSLSLEQNNFELYEEISNSAKKFGF